MERWRATGRRWPRPVERAVRPARRAADPPRDGPDAAPRSRGCAVDRPALRRVGDERRRVESRGPPGTDDRHPACRGRGEHRRGWRGPRLVPARPGRAPPRRPDQAGRLGPVRGDRHLPRAGRPARDQDRPGLQARRGRPTSRSQGHRLHRGAPSRTAWPKLHQPAAAPRHLLDRGPGPAHRGPSGDQSRGPDRGQAGGRPWRRDDRRRCRQGGGLVHPPVRPCGRDRRLAAVLDQACRRTLGARPGRGPPGPAAKRPARSGGAAHRRRAPDRPRPADRRPPRRRGVCVRDRGAGRARLRHGAPVPSRYLPDRHRHPARGPARQVRRDPGRCRPLLHRHRRGPPPRARGRRGALRRRGRRREPAAAPGDPAWRGRNSPRSSARPRGPPPPHVGRIRPVRDGRSATRRHPRSRSGSPRRSVARVRWSRPGSD